MLTPTDNKRLNELIGFLCITFAVLIALALISYSPHDEAFNVSAAAPMAPARNWIGPVGAYGADLLFQMLGFAAFCCRWRFAMLGWRWFRSRATGSHTATLIGYGLLLLSLPSLLSLLLSFPKFAAPFLQAGFWERWSPTAFSPASILRAYLVAPAMLIVTIFMTTSFSLPGRTPGRTARTALLGESRNLASCRRQVALACVERRARARAHAAARGRNADVRPQASYTAVRWQCRLLNEVPKSSAWRMRAMFSRKRRRARGKKRDGIRKGRLCCRPGKNASKKDCRAQNCQGRPQLQTTFAFTTARGRARPKTG